MLHRPIRETMLWGQHKVHLEAAKRFQESEVYVLHAGFAQYHIRAEFQSPKIYFNLSGFLGLSWSYQSPAHIIKIPARGALHIIHGRVVREDPRAVFRGLTVIFYNENAKYDYRHVCDLAMERIRSRLEDPNNNTVPVTQVAHFVDTRE